MTIKYCEVENCENQISGNPRFCKAHYMRYYRYGDPLAGGRFQQKKAANCTVTGCSNKVHAIGLCTKHYNRQRNYGDPNYTKVRTEITGEYTEIDNVSAKIPLTRGYETIVDLEDIPKLIKYNWYAIVQNENYIRAQTIIDGAPVFMHRFLIATTDDKVIDHINRNPLDNRKSNLREVSRAENSRNAERHENRVGVSFAKLTNSWIAYIDEPDRKRKYLGYYKTEEEAKEAVRIAKTTIITKTIDLKISL